MIRYMTEERSGRILYIVILISPIVYLFIILILRFKSIDGFEGVITNNLVIVNLLVVLFLLCTIGNFLLIFKVVIPRFRNMDYPDRNIFQNIFILAYGGLLIATYGLFLGMISWAYSELILFFSAIFFIGVGAFFNVYLYFKYIKKKRLYD